MVRLTSGTIQTIQNCIRTIYTNLDSDTLPDQIIRSVSTVIPAGVTSFARISHSNQRLKYAGRASCRPWTELGAFVRHMDEHPVLNFLHPGHLRSHPFHEDIERSVKKRFPSLRQAQHYTAATISDALPNRRFRSLEIYNEFFRKNDVQYQMLISFLPSRDAYSLISFNRDKRDFTEEERLLLNLLAPHIEQATKNAEAHGAARRAFSLIRHPDRSMRSSGLTDREEDVLYWVAQGKTNGVVARILRIAPGTVKVHLERIYQKLGVENRTAASMLAMGLQGWEREP